jgi:hypothetical protein
MEYKKRLIKFSRKQLYDEIWTSSVSGVAKKYDLNYAKLIISCKQANIPFHHQDFGQESIMEKIFLQRLYLYLNLIWNMFQFT